MFWFILFLLRMHVSRTNKITQNEVRKKLKLENKFDNRVPSVKYKQTVSRKMNENKVSRKMISAGKSGCKTMRRVKINIDYSRAFYRSPSLIPKFWFKKIFGMKKGESGIVMLWELFKIQELMDRLHALPSWFRAHIAAYRLPLDA